MPIDEIHPPEIDIIEYLGHEATQFRSNIISLGPTYHESTIKAGIDLSRDFHRYAIDWSDDDIIVYFDDRPVSTKSIAGQREYSKPFYILVNLAIGSRKSEWVPAPDETTPSPVDMLIRSIRVWRKPE